MRFFYKKFSHEDTKARIIFNRGLTQISTDLFLATELTEHKECAENSDTDLATANSCHGFTRFQSGFLRKKADFAATRYLINVSG